MKQSSGNPPDSPDYPFRPWTGYTLDTSQIHHRARDKQPFVLRDNLESPVSLTFMFWSVGGNQSPLRKKHMQTWNCTHPKFNPATVFESMDVSTPYTRNVSISPLYITTLWQRDIHLSVEQSKKRRNVSCVTIESFLASFEMLQKVSFSHFQVLVLVLGTGKYSNVSTAVYIQFGKSVVLVHHYLRICSSEVYYQMGSTWTICCTQNMMNITRQNRW